VLGEHARIESCQVNSLTSPFSESPMPELLMQDISILGMHSGPDVPRYAERAGLPVASLADWHRVIDWWFDRYGPYAVATKIQNAYSRDIDFEVVEAETAEPLFRRRMAGETLGAEEQKRLEDHLFWHAVRKSTAAGLPVKLHTGYYAGQGQMPLGRLAKNAASASDLCRAAPDTRFVFMHVCYPFYEDILAVAKHYPNAYVDMCWAWIINPVASKDFLKKFLVTAPANKVLLFGGDYIPVEPVLGHAEMARHGMALALSELVDEGWMSLADAVDLVDPLTHGNARRLFDLQRKQQRLAAAPWL
jgi:predicted TIM-barrel fold metal-dependent hydrolase